MTSKIFELSTAMAIIATTGQGTLKCGGLAFLKEKESALWKRQDNKRFYYAEVESQMKKALKISRYFGVNTGLEKS